MRTSLCRLRKRAGYDLGSRYWVGIFCSLLTIMAAQCADVETQELHEAVKVLRKQNDEAMVQLQEATNQVAQVQKDLNHSRLNLISDSEESRSANEWRGFLGNTLKVLAVTDKELQDLRNELSLLHYAAQEAMKSAENVDPKKRSLLEKELRESEKLIVKDPQNEKPLFTKESDAEVLLKTSVLGVELDLGVAALSVGKNDGVRVGMPFLVVRDKDVLAVLTVVEVREKTALALIEQMERDKPIRQGDLAMIRKQ
jgi:hypothetical protein